MSKGHNFDKYHKLLLYSQNVIVNSEPKCLFSNVEGGDAGWKFYWLPVVTEGAEPQEGDGINQAWIADIKVKPQYTNVPMMVFVLEGTVVPNAYRWPFY